MKFTIRDLLWLFVVVALVLGWWVDRRTANSTIALLGEELFRTKFRLVPLEAFTQGADRIYEIKATAEKTTPPPEAAAEILHYVRHEKDYRIRVRAMDVFPQLAERREAINALREALRDQDVERNGEGVVPCYAAAYLARMNAPGAGKEIEAWRESLTKNSPYDTETTLLLIGKADQLLQSAMSNSSAHTPKQSNSSAPSPNPPKP